MTSVRPPIRSTLWSYALPAFVLVVASAVAQGASAASEAVGSTESGAQTSPCSLAVAQGVEWAALDKFLRSRGLALAPQCQASTRAAEAQLVVLDSNKASEVLRGPLADGETVETGAAQSAVESSTNEASTAGYSPDVLFNRSWLQSAMAQHDFVATTGGAWRVRTNVRAVQLALR